MASYMSRTLDKEGHLVYDIGKLRLERTCSGGNKKIIVDETNLPVSRSSLDELIKTATKLPNALKQISTFRARAAPLVPNTF